MSESPLTIRTSEAHRVELLFPLALEILSLNTPVACGTNAVVEFVIVMFTVWSIIDYIKGRSLERLRTGEAGEALLMVPSR